MKHIMGSLPSRQQAGVVIATVFDLTRFYPTEVRLCYSTSALSFVALPFQDVQAFKLRCLYLVISNGVDISFKLSKTFSKRVLILYPKFSYFSFLSILHFFFLIFFSQKFLGDFSEGLFTDDEAIKVIMRFQENLHDISVAIQERNKTLDTPYPYLLPKRVPNSIAI